MLRPVWQTQHYRDTDSNEALQSDVMRFMAILALCLVAIFALVKSLPLHPPRPMETAETTAQPETLATLPEPGGKRRKKPAGAADSPDRSDKFDPADPPSPTPQPTGKTPARKPPPEPTDQGVEREYAGIQHLRHAQTADTDGLQTAIEGPSEASQPEPSEGLMLRFASDTALLALTAQRRVGVHAWTADSAWRLTSQRGVLGFLAEKIPKRLHMMTPTSVPAPVTRALRNSTPVDLGAGVTWGVTLEQSISRRLERLIAQNRSGTLVIHADGKVQIQEVGK